MWGLNGAMMKNNIGIIDADLLGRDKHRFPNLVCEKLSAYWKEQGENVVLLNSYDEIVNFDLVFVAKVFTDTPCPLNVAHLPHNVIIGGTGFYFDKAPNLPLVIEHHMPDYHLYDAWIAKQKDEAKAKAEAEGDAFNEDAFLSKFREFREYSIGFLTRGCFRKCGFCVNKKYSFVFKHSPLSEFYDPSMKKICLLDDNFLGCPSWREMLQELIDTGRPFKFKQGLDERLLDDEKCQLLFNSNYDGDFTFAFDKVTDYDLIKEKLGIINKYRSKQSVKFYVLVGFMSVDYHDIENAFLRISLLLQYGCLPYIMRFQNKNETPWKDSKYRTLYIAIARWCNQPGIIKKMSFREFCKANQALKKDQDTQCSTYKAMCDFQSEHPDIAAKYFDQKYTYKGA
jgi:hypothetical protein